MDTTHGHILIVDDNPVNRKLLERALAEQGHSSATAEHGSRALELLRAAEEPEAFDVVLLDILMPEMDGYETLAQIKNDPALRHIPVIMISGLDEIDSVIRCIEMGAEDYLSKPFNPLLLKARLSASLEKKKLRDLERAYLQQEVMLRQSEKLATLGKLSAGMAHELNNPAAAAQRGIGQLRAAFDQLQSGFLQLGSFELSQAQLEALAELEQQAREFGARPPELDAFVRSEMEMEVESWLDERLVENAWEYAPALLWLARLPAGPDRLAQAFAPHQLSAIMVWLAAVHTIETLLQEVGHSTRRISEIVNALKSYSYMDQAPVQTVDLHHSLESTLALLAGKLAGITVRQEYAPDLPKIEAYGSELNQVWTHLIDNASAALAGQGEITLRTHREANWAVVAVEDNGPGIPEDIQSKIFDPFFTTKPVGEGAGLGLSVSHNIVVQKHRGRITVRSHPGQTVFEVYLPLNGVQG